MTFREKTTETVEEINESQEPDELETIDIGDDVPWVKFGTGVFITGTLPEGEGSPVVRFPSPDNNNGRYDQGYLAIVLDDPGFVVSEEENTDGTVVVDVDDKDEYRVFNPNSGQTTQKSDNAIQFADNTTFGEIMEPEEFDADRIALVVSGSGSVSVAKALDVKGITARQIWDEEGGYARNNGGLIEYNSDPNSDEPRSRYTANNVQLRDELYSQEIGILCDWRSTFDEDYAEMVDEGERRDQKFFSVFNMETEEQLQPGDYGERVERTYLKWTWDEDFGPEDDPTVGSPELTDEEREFVERYREVEDQPFSVDEVVEAVEENEDSFESEPDTDAIVEALT